MITQVPLEWQQFIHEIIDHKFEIFYEPTSNVLQQPRGTHQQHLDGQLSMPDFMPDENCGMGMDMGICHPSVSFERSVLGK